MGLVFLSLDRLSYTGYSDVQEACLSSSFGHWSKVTQPKLLREMESAPSVAALCLPLLLCLSLFTSVQAATGTHALHEAAAKEQSLIANWSRRVACTIPWNIVYRLPREYELLLQWTYIAFYIAPRRAVRGLLANIDLRIGTTSLKSASFGGNGLCQQRGPIANSRRIAECHSIPPVVEYTKKVLEAWAKFLILVWWCKHKYTVMPASCARLVPCSLLIMRGICTLRRGLSSSGLLDIFNHELFLHSWRQYCPPKMFHVQSALVHVHWGHESHGST